MFGNRKINHYIKTHAHQSITYRSFKHIDDNKFSQDLHDTPWEISEMFNDINQVVWNDMFLEVVNKHAPVKSRRIKRKYQPDWLTPEILDHTKRNAK